MSILIVAGTRPEAIKLAPVLWNLRREEYVFVWSGQHYDYEMSRIFFEQLGLPEPDVDLDVRSGTHAEQTAKIMMGLEKAIEKYKPAVVVAEGDTNTVVAAALTAVKKFVPFAHVEAGLRSWDRTMPEEINRIVADAVAELHFAPTELAAINLMHEGVPIRKIHITGNTVVDVVYRYLEEAKKWGRRLMDELRLEPQTYILVTIHRQENTDNAERLWNITKAIAELAKKYPVVFPIHPRTANKMKEQGLLQNLSAPNIHLLKPLGYFQFLGLLADALVVLTDSGGVQEEACTLRIPTITLRYNTERPETVLVGINKVVGVEWQRVVEETLSAVEKRDELVKRASALSNPLGDGKAGERIAAILKRAVEEGIKVPSSDTREKPAITYAVTEAPQPTDEVVAMYDERGLATVDKARARLYLVRR